MVRTWAQAKGIPADDLVGWHDVVVFVDGERGFERRRQFAVGPEAAGHADAAAECFS